jgi:dimethylglycine dehydrogenase
MMVPWSAKRPRAPGATAWRTSIALGMLRSDLAVAGNELEVDIFGERRPAIVQPDGPLWDPGNDRLRA